jgi:hypothetical protein
MPSVIGFNVVGAFYERTMTTMVDDHKLGGPRVLVEKHLTD